MHLGNGAITPECAVAGFTAAVAGLGVCLWYARRSQPVSVAKAVAAGSVVFAAQMINVPVIASSSAHFIGGVLLAELLGPALGAMTMAIVLLVQALLLGDGGLASLGVNVVNMALLPAGMLSLARRFTSQRRASIGLASVASVALAVLVIAGATAIGRANELDRWPEFMQALMETHVVVLFAEAIVTLALVAAWRYAEQMPQQRISWIAGSVMVVALLLAGFSWAISSPLPDGYESAAETAKLEMLLAEDADAIATQGELNASLNLLQMSIVDGVSRLLSSEMAVAVIATLATMGLIAASTGAFPKPAGCNPRA